MQRRITMKREAGTRGRVPPSRPRGPPAGIPPVLMAYDLEVIARECAGESDRPPLLFVHGAGHGAWCWASIADYVSDVERVAADLPREPVLVGHSLGGLVVQKYLEAHEPPAAVLLAPPSVRGLLRPAVRTFLRLWAVRRHSQGTSKDGETAGGQPPLPGVLPRQTPWMS